MSAIPDSKGDAPESKTDDGAKPLSQLPPWIPRWMSTHERAAFIIALGLVASAIILIVGTLFLLLWASKYY